MVISLTALISAPVYATAPETNELMFYGYNNGYGSNTIVKYVNFTPLGHYISSGELYGGVGASDNPNAIDIYANRYNTAETVQWVSNKMLTLNKVPWEKKYMVTNYSDSIFFKDDSPQKLYFAVYGTLTLELDYNSNETDLFNCYNVILAQGQTNSVGVYTDNNWWIFSNAKDYEGYDTPGILLNCITVNDPKLSQIEIMRPTKNNGKINTSQDYPSDAGSDENLFLIHFSTLF